MEHEPHLHHGEPEGGHDLKGSVHWAFVGEALGTGSEVGEGRLRTFHKEYVPSFFGQCPPCLLQNVYRCRHAPRSRSLEALQIPEQSDALVVDVVPGFPRAGRPRHYQPR